MAKFKPGNNANPKGRPPGPTPERQWREILGKRFEEYVYKYHAIPRKDLELAAQNKDLPNLEYSLANWLLSLDPREMDLMFTRIFGKPKETVDHNVRMKPSILKKVDGEEIVFTKLPVKEDE